MTGSFTQEAVSLDELRAEVEAVLEDVSAMSADLTGRFFDLAGHSREQVGRIEDMHSKTGAVVVDGERVELTGVLSHLGDTLSEFARQVVFLSKEAVVMVRSMETILEGIQELEGFVEHIDSVTGKTNMLALNARIEAERAGAAGVSFRVVADEVRELSKGTATLAGRMKEKIHMLAGALREGHSVLAEVAAMDMTRQIEAKEKIDLTLDALLDQTHALESQSAAGLDQARGIDAAIGRIVTDMQFEDRVNQRLAHVARGMELLSQILAGRVTPEEGRGRMGDLLAHRPVRHQAEPSAPAGDAAADDVLLF